MSTRCYEIEADILILRVALDSFTRTVEIIRAASQDAAAGHPMRLLIDLRAALLGLNYEDMRSQAQALVSMQEVLAPQWAVLAANSPSAMNAAFIFATLAGSQHVEVRVFADEEEALFWLRQRKP